MQINCVATVVWYVVVSIGSRYSNAKKLGPYDTEEDVLRYKEELEKLNIFDDIHIKKELIGINISGEEYGLNSNLN